MYFLETIPDFCKQKCICWFFKNVFRENRWIVKNARIILKIQPDGSVDFEKCCKMRIWVPNFVSIQSITNLKKSDVLWLATKLFDFGPPCGGPRPPRRRSSRPARSSRRRSRSPALPRTRCRSPPDVVCAASEKSCGIFSKSFLTLQRRKGVPIK